MEGRISSRWNLLLLAALILTTLMGFLANYSDFAKTILKRRTPVQSVRVDSNEGYKLALPKILLQRGIYNESDFVNEKGVVPAYWGSTENDTDHTRRYGPCYAYRYKQDVDWETEIDNYNRTDVTLFNEGLIRGDDAQDLHGFCRPGFIIIGAGKAGTSSLYHYITSHPRVLGASQKQIHYFKVRILFVEN